MCRESGAIPFKGASPRIRWGVYGTSFATGSAISLFCNRRTGPNQLEA